MLRRHAVEALWTALGVLLVVAAVVVGLSFSHGSRGRPGGNGATTTLPGGPCPRGLTRQVIGQVSPPGSAPVLIIQCSASIPVEYAREPILAP